MTPSSAFPGALLSETHTVYGVAGVPSEVMIAVCAKGLSRVDSEGLQQLLTRFSAPRAGEAQSSVRETVRALGPGEEVFFRVHTPIASPTFAHARSASPRSRLLGAPT
jgi:hypothetical protein